MSNIIDAPLWLTSPIYVMPCLTAAAWVRSKFREKYGMDISGFLDNLKGGTEQDGLPVYTPGEAPDKNATVILCSERFRTQLQELGFPKERVITTDQCLFCEEDKLTMTRTLALVVTQRCSLKCRNCCAFAQYYEHPKDFSVEIIQKEIEFLFQKVDFVLNLNIIGGEPFMFREFDKILLSLCAYRDRIGELAVPTNGTILPGKAVVNALKKADVLVRFSDYGALSAKRDMFINLLKSQGIRNDVVWNAPDAQWYIPPAFSDNVLHSEEILRHKFAHCAGGGCLVYLNGKLSYCDFIGYGSDLKGIPFNTANSIDIFSETIGKTDISDYIHRASPFPACAYCTGSAADAKKIPIAEQVKEPLPYIHYE